MGFLSSIGKALKKGVKSVAKAVAPVAKAVAPTLAAAALPGLSGVATSALGLSTGAGGILTTVAETATSGGGLQSLLTGALQQVGGSCVGCGGSTPTPAKAVAVSAMPAMAAPPILSAGTLGLLGLALWLVFGRSK